MELRAAERVKFLHSDDSFRLIRNAADKVKFSPISKLSCNLNELNRENPQWQENCRLLSPLDTGYL